MARKVGSAGRFGTRYGRSVRTLIADIEKKQKVKHKCPYCSKTAVKRLAFGIFKCNKCNSKFAGKAYFIE
nr:50S ribosomal protein L37ae [Candidatus Woesearchaeota archaeon]